MTGGQQGMCKRTKELPFTGGAARGRMGGGRRRFTGQPQGQMAQSRRRFAQGEEFAGSGSQGTAENELAELKEQYREVHATLTEIASKIESLEKKVVQK